MLNVKLYVAAALIAIGSASAVQAEIIDTTVNGNGGDIWPFGNPDTATYGQTFVVGGDDVLKGFSLYLGGNVAEPFNFKGYIYAWNGSRADGAQLYESAVREYAGGNAPLEFAFDTGNLQLTSGSKYVAFLSTSGLQDGVSSTATMPRANGGDLLPGGDFVYFNNGNDFSRLTTSSWDCSGCGFGDVWFKASLSAGDAVPEPATWAMMIGGFGMAGAAMRRRVRMSATYA